MFQYKKKQYENVYRWKNSGVGDCFYCKQPKTLDEIAHRFFEGSHKGICHDCFSHFQVGDLKTDEKVIRIIAPTFRNHDDAIQWFRGLGHIEEKNKQSASGSREYYFIYDQTIFNNFIQQARKTQTILAYDNEEDGKRGFNKLEVFEDGSYNIEY